MLHIALFTICTAVNTILFSVSGQAALKLLKYAVTLGKACRPRWSDTKLISGKGNPTGVLRATRICMIGPGLHT